MGAAAGAALIPKVILIEALFAFPLFVFGIRFQPSSFVADNVRVVEFGQSRDLTEYLSKNFWTAGFQRDFLDGIVAVVQPVTSFEYTAKSTLGKKLQFYKLTLIPKIYNRDWNKNLIDQRMNYLEW